MPPHAQRGSPGKGCLLDRSMPKTVSPRLHRVEQKPMLKTFDVCAQQYGTFFAGFGWGLYCTGTYRTKLSRSGADPLFRSFVSRLQDALKAPVAYIAAQEFRTSGLGFPAIPLHWHFMLATPPHLQAALKRSAKRLWEEHHGNFHAGAYDARRSGAWYIAKLASHTNFHYLVENLDRLTYNGPTDLYGQMQEDPYVPTHVRHRPCGQTLMLSPRAKPTQLHTSLDGSALQCVL